MKKDRILHIIVKIALINLCLAVIAVVILMLEYLGINDLRTTYEVWIRGGALISLLLFGLLMMPLILDPNDYPLDGRNKLVFYVSCLFIYSAIIPVVILLLPQNILEYLGINDLHTAYQNWIKGVALVSLIYSLIVPWIRSWKPAFYASCDNSFPIIPFTLSALAAVGFRGMGHSILFWISVGNMIAVFLILLLDSKVEDEHYNTAVRRYWSLVEEYDYQRISTYPSGIGNPPRYKKPSWVVSAQFFSWSIGILIVAWTLLA